MKCLHRRKTRKFQKNRMENVRCALEEDCFLGDLTSDAVFTKDAIIEGQVVSGGRCVLSGVEEFHELFGKACVVKKKDGEFIRSGETVLVVKGRAKYIFRRIRVGLNYLSYLSGIATNARRLDRRFGGRVVGLRKTHPCLGVSEKNALQNGGLPAHRMNLGDSILIKKEHLSLVRKELSMGRGKSVFVCCQRAKRYVKKKKLKDVFVEVEVENLEELRAAAVSGVDIIMLDNVGKKMVGGFVKEIRKYDKKVLIEASGGLGECDVSYYLKSGVDVVSGRFVLDAKPINFRFILSR